MSNKLTTSLRNVLAFEWRQPHDVHFHAGSDGRPFVCDHSRCDSARLSAAEAGFDR